MFERLRAAIEAALDAAAGPPDRRRITASMREGIGDARAALVRLREGATTTERRLVLERKYLEDAERRGRLAGQIDDRETVDIAERFAAKHRERVAVLERKLEAQRSELMLAEQELDEMKEQLKKVDASAQFEEAWRELDTAARPAFDLREDLLQSQLDRAAREARAEAQLAELKRKMGR